MSSNTADVQMESVNEVLRKEKPSLEELQRALITVATFISGKIALEYGVPIAMRYPKVGPYCAQGDGPHPFNHLLDLVSYALCVKEPVDPDNGSFD